jgi:hypothetical protein
MIIELDEERLDGLIEQFEKVASSKVCNFSRSTLGFGYIYNTTETELLFRGFALAKLGGYFEIKEDEVKIGDTVILKVYNTKHEVLGESTDNKSWCLSNGVGNFYKHLCEKTTDH